MQNDNLGVDKRGEIEDMSRFSEPQPLIGVTPTYLCFVIILLRVN